jgi:hypothetical protein
MKRHLCFPSVFVPKWLSNILQSSEAFISFIKLSLNLLILFHRYSDCLKNKALEASRDIETGQIIRAGKFADDLVLGFLVNGQLDAQFFSMYLFQFSTRFEQPRTHHQDNQLYQYNI